MKRLHLGLWAFALLALIGSCTDPTLVGSDLLDDDKVTFDYLDTVNIVATTIPGDSIRTYSPILESQLTSYLFGDMVDPIFGRSTASLYLQPLPERTNPDFTNIEIDSIILVLPYDTNAFYGNTAATFDMEVLELSEVLDRSEEYFSNQTVMTEAVPLASISFQPKFDSVTVVDHISGQRDTNSYPAQLRIPLGLDLAENLTRLDSAVYASDSTFVEFFKGIHLRPSSTNEGLLAFNLRNSLLGGIHIYYRMEDTIPLQFQYPLISISTRFANFTHDYSGAVVEPYLDDSSAGEEFLFVQGMAGTNVHLTFPDLDELEENVIVNQAILEVTVAEINGDPEGVFDPSPGLILTRFSDEGGLQVIEDVETITLRGLSLSELFGGIVQENADTGLQTYEMNLSAHFQEILDGTVPNELILSTFPKAERGARSVLFGTQHPEFAIKLRLAITRL